MWIVEPNFVVRLGGTKFINVPNLLVYKGESLFRIRRNEDDGTLGIDFEVFDAEGNRIATFAKGIVAQGDGDNYLIQTGHDAYSVTERATHRVIARVQRRGVDGAELDVQVTMYLPNGFLLEATPEGINMPGLVMIGGTMKNAKNGISVG